jgi:hypothetical protein
MHTNETNERNYTRPAPVYFPAERHKNGSNKHKPNSRNRKQAREDKRYGEWMH